MAAPHERRVMTHDAAECHFQAKGYCCTRWERVSRHLLKPDEKSSGFFYAPTSSSTIGTGGPPRSFSIQLLKVVFVGTEIEELLKVDSFYNNAGGIVIRMKTNKF